MTALEDKLNRYKEPSSPNEKDRQERAERMVRQAVNGWPAFEDITLSFMVKGSYCNNTNVRYDSDVDIAVIHEGFHYFDDSALAAVDQRTGGVAITHLSSTELRTELGRCLVDRFGDGCDTKGKTALTISGNSGRVNTDVVPSYRHVTYFYTAGGQIGEHWGNVVYRKDGSRIVNYPQQQRDNGRAKNTATNQRYKQVVRILKRIENDLVAAGEIVALPSYLMECLVYPISNDLFRTDPYSPIPLTEICRSVFAAIWSATREGGLAAQWCEPNGIKPLFASSQPWTMQQANVLALKAFRIVNAGHA